MKKLKYLVVLIAFLVLAGCSKEDVNVVEPDFRDAVTGSYTSSKNIYFQSPGEQSDSTEGNVQIEIKNDMRDSMGVLVYLDGDLILQLEKGENESDGVGFSVVSTEDFKGEKAIRLGWKTYDAVYFNDSKSLVFYGRQMINGHVQYYIKSTIFGKK